jgi:hypothetical protein
MRDIACRVLIRGVRCGRIAERWDEEGHGYCINHAVMNGGRTVEIKTKKPKVRIKVEG